MKKEFGCEQCGHILVAVAPDDAHTVLLIEKAEEQDCIKTIYRCDDCNKEIIRYWCTPAPRRIIGLGARDPYDDMKYY